MNYGTRTRGGFGNVDELAADAEPGPVTIDTPTSLPPAEPEIKIPAWYHVAAAVSGPACLYHGYKRNNSIGWGIAWSLFGGALPLLAVPIALAQGFGKKKAGR